MGTTNCGSEKSYTGGSTPSTTLTPIANILKTMAEDIAERSQDTEKRVNCKLASIMNDRLPEEKEECDPIPVWPPLFSQLRDSLDLIKAALNGINKMIDRVEL